MTDKTIPALFVTANVGSIFEDPSVMLKLWTEEFLSTVSRLDPKFVALHCQEVGGKNYEQSMKHVEYFVRLLMTSEELRLFDKVRVYLDEDFSSAENFTALGNFYFIHESVQDVLIWDFKEFRFVAVEGKDVHSGNIEDVLTKEKSKFPQDFFPECKWSRKGFLRTRWNLNGTIFDLVNIHLFHDASNFIAMETFPSVYSKTRQRALEYTLHRFHTDEFGSSPLFLFGDFNFRTDTQGVIKKLSDGLVPVHVQSSNHNDHTKLLYRDESSQIILTLGKKEFIHHDHQNVFIENAGEWLKKFDHELEGFEGQLFEYPITFPPSYPYQEDAENGHAYMTTRCPAWCDRVILSKTAKQLVVNDSNVEYGSIGENTCMGDHKPVYLRLDLLGDAGRVICCEVDRSVLHETCIPINMDFFPIERSPCVVAKNVERTDSFSNILLANYLPILVPYEQNLSLAGVSNDQLAPVIVDSESDTSIKCDSSVNFDVSSLSDSPVIVPELPEIEKPNVRNSRLRSDGNIEAELGKANSKSLKDRKSEFLEEGGESKNVDRYSVKRVQSASFAEVRRVGSLRQGACRCLSESQSWRARSESVSSRKINWRSNSKVKLISDPNLQSLLRLQSHHSSSDEDWFEEVSNDENVNELELKHWVRAPALDDVELKIPVANEINSIFEPAESLEDTAVGKIVYEDQRKAKFKCFTAKRKHRKLKNKTDAKTENKENVGNLRLEGRCCIIT